jgi:hypothetical protein
MQKNTNIYHIAGITDLYKDQLIMKLKKLNIFLIYDLDDETEKIYKMKEIQTKIKDLLNLKPTAKKKVEVEITEIWKDRLNEYIKKIIKDNESSRHFGIIFIGNITSGSISFLGDKSNSVLNIKHAKTKIVIPSSQHFFLKVNFKENAQEIIKFNLKKYHDDIVNGEFPLDFINLEFLINTREQLQSVYQKMKYNLFTFDKIIHYFQQGIHEKKPDLLYIVLPEEYKKTIQLKKKVYGFTEDWIALSSLTTGLDRGYTDGYAYIKEQIKGSLKKLETSTYIYVVSSRNFLPVENNNVKFVSEQPIKIIKSIKIENVLHKLKDMKIKFV